MIKQEKFDEELFNKKVPYLGMHTIQHIGQGLRLHKMNIRDLPKITLDLNEGSN